jgi:hypothetical protein
MLLPCGLWVCAAREATHHARQLQHTLLCLTVDLELLPTWPGSVRDQQQALNMVCCGEGVCQLVLDVAAARVDDFCQPLLQGVHLARKTKEQCFGLVCSSNPQQGSSSSSSSHHEVVSVT